VVYGLVGMKTHAKVLLVTRRQGNRLQRYVHFSTGNYNPRTARLYTDLGHFTADPALTADADAVFQHLASLNPLRPTQRLLVAPSTLRAGMIERVERVAEAARAGRSARVVAKLNALTDPPLIEALVHAAQAGAQIDLIVRGACMLPPGVPGHTDKVRVRSVVGRFLEHSRILLFRWGDADGEEALYLSSADWMTRNMTRRIELAWPVDDPALRRRVIEECLMPYLEDDVDAWALAADGSYTPVPTTQGVAAQRRIQAAVA
jgi:polyphosphate kinase